ncbi:MAG: DUF420 domain-containing protein [Planctomycetales bacterium]|nr:DUF420 domain-containing protein [Planctomycetales bacterium]
MSPSLLAAAHPLAHLNAALNALATVLLIAGFLLIRRRREQAHLRVMLTAFWVSVVFLISYLAHKVWPVGAGSTPFPGPPAVRSFVYLPILISHIILAAFVPVLALVTIILGLKNRRPAHRRWAKFTFPIWLYVSITGVVVYLLLYWTYPLPA